MKKLFADKDEFWSAYRGVKIEFVGKEDKQV